MQVYDGAVDKGLEGVIACTTGISSIVDATLCYRGFKIEDLAAHSSFAEVVFLLWNDRLPNADELQSFRTQLSKDMTLDPGLVDVLKAMPTKNVHPMAWLRTAVSAMALWDNQSQSVDEAEVKQVCQRITAKMGSLVTLFHRLREGLEIVQPKADQSMAWNFLYQLRGEAPPKEMEDVFDTCLVLHADHELNCSAFSSRVTSSSLSDVYSAVTSAIGTLKGPLHGGANEQVMRTLREIGSVDNAPQWLETALSEKKKIMGFGHRVYKNGDPRAKILRGMSETLTKLAGEPQWYEISKYLDEEVKERKGLLPNVDFYSATVYNSMGIPLDLYTPIFATSRVSGWVAHILEQYSQNRIYRPRGKWVGKVDQKYPSS